MLFDRLLPQTILRTTCAPTSDRVYGYDTTTSVEAHERYGIGGCVCVYRIVFESTTRILLASPNPPRHSFGRLPPSPIPCTDRNLLLASSPRPTIRSPFCSLRHFLPALASALSIPLSLSARSPLFSSFSSALPRAVVMRPGAPRESCVPTSSAPLINTTGAGLV